MRTAADDALRGIGRRLPRGGEEELRSVRVVVCRVVVRIVAVGLLRGDRASTRGQTTMQIKRRFTTAGKSPYEQHSLPPRHVRDQESGRLGRLPARELRGPRALEPGGGRHPGAEVLPQGRRAGTPQARRGDAGAVLAVALGRRRARARPSVPQGERSGGETDARQVFDRLAGTWTYWGWKGGYFATEEDARAFFDEHRYMLAMQTAPPTARNGSTPACTGPTASTARARATTTSTTGPAS